MEVKRREGQGDREGKPEGRKKRKGGRKERKRKEKEKKEERKGEGEPKPTWCRKQNRMAKDPELCYEKWVSSYSGYFMLRGHVMA